MAYRSQLRPPSFAAHARRTASPRGSLRSVEKPSLQRQGSFGMLGPATVASSQALLFQLEIDSRDALRPKVQPPRRDVHSVARRVEDLDRPESNFEARLGRDARYYHGETLAEEGRADVVILASRLAGVGYSVTIRNALGGGSGVSAFRHLSHEFLVVAGPSDAYSYGGTAEYIIDPRFREQFDIPQTVEWYDTLLLSVPETYVGPPSRLRALVRLLGGEMAAAFADAGAVTPPWRSVSSLLSKWQPTKSRDQHVGDPALASPPTSPMSFPRADFGGLGGGGSRGSTPSFARHGERLRTTSVPAVLNSSQPAAAFQQPTAAAAAAPRSSNLLVDFPEEGVPGNSPPPLMALSGRSESEGSSPESTVSWPTASRLGGDAAAAKTATPATHSKDAAALDPPRGNLHRSISREQLAAGSGGRSPRAKPHIPMLHPTAADGIIAAVAVAPPRAAAADTSFNPFATHAVYRARASPPQRHRSIPEVDPLPAAAAAEAPLRRRSTSALSTKLASVGLGHGVRSDAPPPPQPGHLRNNSSPAPLPQGPRPQPQPATSVLLTQQPPPAQQQNASQLKQEPSVHAPFWDQPLIMDYIAAQQPDGSKAKSSAGGDLQGEPRIRTVKMRGAATPVIAHGASRGVRVR